MPSSAVSSRDGSRTSPSPTFPRKAAIVLVVALVISLVALGYEFGIQSTGTSPSTPATPTTVAAYVNLTVIVNATNGAPQYVPANFTIPAGLVAVTIQDQDSPMNWSQCGCVVGGTIGNTEWVNGTSYHVVPDSNVAHTFTIPKLGINVLSPGGSTVFFEAVFPAGTYTWYCMATCGSNGETGFPMGTPGWMEGTITVE